jgi:hypothetical protein
VTVRSLTDSFVCELFLGAGNTKLAFTPNKMSKAMTGGLAVFGADGATVSVTAWSLVH